MENRLLFVHPLNPNDILLDIESTIRQIGVSYGCRAMLFIATVPSSDVNVESDQLESAHSQIPVSSEVDSGDANAGIQQHLVKRRIGGSVVLATPNFPSNDDLAAVRVHLTDHVKSESPQVIVIGDRLGMFPALISHAIKPESLYFVRENDEDPDFLAVQHGNLDGIPNLRPLLRSVLDSVTDPAGAHALVFVDPDESDFTKYAGHLGLNGVLIVVSTDGTRPEVPSYMEQALRQSTNSVLWCLRLPSSKEQQDATA